jgi:SAM-dependent MidA family methyltransferase
MWRVMAEPRQFWIVEAGAGSGALARNILDFAKSEFPDFYSALKYVVVERGAGRRAMHEAILGDHLIAKRCESAAEMPHVIPEGCILSNELLDALPVHRVTCDKGSLKEILIGVDGEKPNGGILREQLGPLSTCAIAEYFAAQRIDLADGQQAEAGLEACDWILEVGRRLGRGFVLTIDYGHEAAELYGERHFSGTLLAYREHRVGEDFLAAPGEQDLTAHVNFTALDEWGQRAGLIQTGLVSQSRFLLALGEPNQFADLYEHFDSEFDSARDQERETQSMERSSELSKREVEKIRARLLLKTLIFPEGMGETFKVMVQHTGIEEPALTGLGLAHF